MGWLLLQSGTNRRFSLRPGTVQIGRIQTAQIRPNHQSVSRVHADVCVEPHGGPLSEITPAPIRIIDRSSTGHTFINNQPPGKGQPLPLADGDTIALGVDPETFTVRWSPVVLSYSSRMPEKEVRGMEELARAAGVFLTSEWTSDCTHLLIEQQAITPKFLCCVADGGMPVAASFLHALSTRELAGDLPEPAAHRPKPIAGPDVAFATELEGYLQSPRPRHAMLNGVWVIFGVKQAYNALSTALVHTGSEVHFLCTSLEQAKKVAQDFKVSKSAQGSPKEVWLVPGLDQGSASFLAEPLQGLGTRCIEVPLDAVVGGILAGRVDIVHSKAAAFGVKPKKPEDEEPPQPPKDTSFPETQKQPQQQLLPLRQAPPEEKDKIGASPRKRRMPWGTKQAAAEKLEQKEVKKEHESFPNTQQQQQQKQQQQQLQAPAAPLAAVATAAGPAAMLPPQVAPAAAWAVAPRGNAAAPAAAAPCDAALKRAPPGVEAADAPAAQRQRTLQSAAAPSGPARAVAVKPEKTEDKPQLAPQAGADWRQGSKPLRSAAPVAAGTVAGSTSAFSSALGPPLAPAGPPQPSAATVGSSGAGGAGAAALSVLSQAPLSQPKIERALLVESQYSQAKYERAPPTESSHAVKWEQRQDAEVERKPLAAVAGAALNGALPGAQPVLDSLPQVQRPQVGIWLSSLGQKNSTSLHHQEESIIIDGVALPRAAWRPGAVQPEVPAPERAANKVRGGEGIPSNGASFKVFRKSRGQTPAALRREPVVPVSPWAPAAGPPLSEVFGSQPLESESLVPPMILT